MKKSLEHAVLVFFQFSQGKLDNENALNAVFSLQDILTEVIEKEKLGVFDGNEFCEDTVTFFIYGPDADKICKAIAPVVARVPFLPGSYILKRYGNDTNAKEEQILLF